MFDQTDLDHLTSGATVEVRYTVYAADRTVMHETDLLMDAAKFAAVLQSGMDALGIDYSEADDESEGCEWGHTFRPCPHDDLADENTDD